VTDTNFTASEPGESTDARDPSVGFALPAVHGEIADVREVGTYSMSSVGIVSV